VFQDQEEGRMGGRWMEGGGGGEEEEEATIVRLLTMLYVVSHGDSRAKGLHFLLSNG